MNIPQDVILAARDGMKTYLIPASVSIAQWALESGWGAHSPGNNPFGMKPRKGMNDPQQMLMTTEVVHGKAVKEFQPFRLFKSIDEAFVAHAQLIASAPVYAKAMSILPHGACATGETVDLFINEMAKHYATDPLYANKLESIISKNNLDRYDV